MVGRKSVTNPAADQRIFRSAWLIILLNAAFLRLWPIGSGLPYIDYIDEGLVLHQTQKVLQEKTYDIGLYDYPSVPSYRWWFRGSTR